MVLMKKCGTRTSGYLRVPACRWPCSTFLMHWRNKGKTFCLLLSVVFNLLIFRVTFFLKPYVVFAQRYLKSIDMFINHGHELLNFVLVHNKHF